MNKYLPSLIRIIIVLLIIVFVAICACFFPNFSTYIEGFLSERAHDTDYIRPLVYIYGTVLTLPCIVMLIMSLKLPLMVAEDRVFTTTTASLLSNISLIMCIDCILFLLAVIALFYVGEYTVSPILSLVDLIGLSLAFLLRVLSDYIKRAAKLKEEVDATL